MDTTKWAVPLLTLLLGMLWLGGRGWHGCGSPATGDEDTVSALGEVMSPDSIQSLAGAYKESEESSLLHGLLLTKTAEGARIFSAEMHFGCEHPARLEGTWSASRKVLSLNVGTEPGYNYLYSLNGTTLTLRDRSKVVAILSREPTFCSRSSDCELQSYEHIECIGVPVCTNEQTCGWNCGVRRSVYGDLCEGIAGLRCSTGFQCNLEDERGCSLAQRFPDASGICRPATDSSCSGYLCTTGEHCAIVGGDAACVPDSQNVCPRVRCRGDRPHCVEWSPTGEMACLAPDQCHRNSDCQARQRCQPEDVCIRAPCFTALICR